MYPSRNSFATSRTILSVFLSSVVTFFGPSAGYAATDHVLTIASFGGAYTRSQIVAYIDPFRKVSRQWVEVVDYDGGLDEVREQVRSLNVKWDVVDMSGADAIRACDEGLLERLDSLPLAPSPSGKPPADDFLEGSLLPCAIGQNIWSTVIAYDSDAYEGQTVPSTVSDFFDLERFPGSRALQKTPRVNFEWALLADGVAPDAIYAVLETEEGLSRALSRLEQIRPAIVWWTKGEEPLDLIQRRRVAMSSAWNGRVFFRNRGRNGAISTIWNGSVWDREYWVIPKGSPNVAGGKALIVFATDAERQAAQANQIAYSPARRSATAMVSSDVLPFLPTEPENASKSIASNAKWWARNGDRLEEVFRKWAESTRSREFGRRGGD